MKSMFLMLLLISGQVSSKEFEISEAQLLEMIKLNNPSLSEIESTFFSSKVQALEAQDKLGYEFYTGYNHQNTKEKPLIVFQPVFSNVNQYKVGVKKYTKYGVVLDINRSIDTRSSGEGNSLSLRDLTTTTDEFGIQMDLWRDFMGRVTKAQLKNVKAMEKKDNLQAQIAKNVLAVNVRKLYWNLVANSEKIRITEGLYKTAKKQAANARRRKASSVTDRAEVARFESLVHARKGSLLSLEYEREILFKNLRDVFPQLNRHDLKLAKVNFDKALFEVLACTAKINQQEVVPYDHTQYDEIVALLKGMQERQLQVDDSYGKVDLTFDLKLRRVGVASETTDNSIYTGSYADSVSDMNDNDRGAMAAGIMLKVPFGENQRGTTAVKKALTEKQFESSVQKLESNVISTHHQIKKSVQLLTQVIREQKANSKQLSIRVREMQKKYSQARIPEYALIQDEDSLLSSDLTVVDTQLLVVSTILDYLSVFNTYPCSFNRN